MVGARQKIKIVALRSGTEVAGMVQTYDLIKGGIEDATFLPNNWNNIDEIKITNNGGSTENGSGYINDLALDINGFAYTATTAAPVVLTPVNGATNVSSTPTYTGTAPGNSTITIYVDGVALSSNTSDAAGNWTKTQPTSLTDGSHTVKATAQSNGETVSANSNTNNFVVDATRPTVAINSTASSTTSTSPIPVTVTFSENVTGFVLGDINVTNGTPSALSGSGANYTFNVSPTASGAVTVNVPANVAVDAAGNGNTAASQLSRTYTPAVVSSIKRLLPSPAALQAVTFEVIFSTSVSGVTVSNFSVTISGLSTASVSSVVGSGTTYKVTVNTGTGNGILRLNVANSTGITPTITNTPYVAGETYTITKSFTAAPELTIVGTGGLGSDVTAFVDAVQVFNGNTAFANGLQNGSFEQHEPLSNGDFGYQPTAANWTFNSRAGIAESGSAFTPTTPVPNGISVALIQSTGSTHGQISQRLALPTGSDYKIIFQASQRICCTTLDQSLNVFLEGVFLGNIQPSPDNYSQFTSAIFAVAAPALTAIVSSTATGPTTTSPIPLKVTFSQAVTGFTASDITVGNGTLNNFAGSGADYTFNIVPTANGAVTADIAANVAVDANNTGNTAVSQFSITYNQPVTAAPTITLPLNNTFTNNGSLTISGKAPANSTVSFLFTRDNQAQSSGSPVTADANGNYSLGVNFSPGVFTVSAAAQSTGEAISVRSSTITFTIDVTKPTVSITSTAGVSGSSTGTSPIPITVTFSEAVTGFAAEDIVVANGTISAVSGSGSTYTFNVTPALAGTATTVSIGASVAQDVATNDNAAASPFTITYQQVLPVSLTTYTAKAEANAVKLEWLTESERHNDRFEVSRSMDGLNFTSIGTVKGNGTTATKHRYYFYDRSPLNGTNYYRLTQVDHDGKTAEIGIRSVDVKLAIEQNITVYPNPATNTATVNFNLGTTSLLVLDLAGKKLVSKAIKPTTTSAQINVAQFPSGTYLIKTLNDKGTATVKLIKL